MITTSLKWFLGISVAAHAAVLVAWQAPAWMPGKTGHALQLSVMQRSTTGAVQAPAMQQPVQHEPENRAAPVQAERIVRKVIARTTVPRQQRSTPAPETQPSTLGATTPPDVPDAETGTPAGSPVFSAQETDQHLRNSVMELLTRELTYPAIARRKGWQGIVKLELHIEPDGSITGLQIDKSSGYTSLDNAALQCLQFASLPDAARWLQGQAVDIVVPVEYRLVDG